MRQFSWILLGVLLGAAAIAVYKLPRPAPPAWTATRLAGPRAGYAPRISPDGKLLAFAAIVDGQSQVALMNPQSGSWTLLTHDPALGLTNTLSWSPDGGSIYFDRVFETPRGVYSVPAGGGETRLVLAGAGGPIALPDGSLIVVRVDAQGNWRMHRYWPESKKLDALNAVTVPFQNTVPAQATSDGKELMFFGKPADAAPTDAFALWKLDLAGGRAVRLEAAQPVEKIVSQAFFSGYAAMAVPAHAHDALLLNLPAGDLHRVASLSWSGDVSPLFTLTGQIHFLDASPDGSLYLDQWERPAEILKFPPSGGSVERVGDSAGYSTGPMLELPEQRLLTTSLSPAGQRLMISSAGRNPIRLLETQEESGPGIAVLNDRELAVGLGAGQEHTIAVVSIADGRLIRRLQGPRGQTGDILAASPDGRTLYYSYGGAIWALPAADGRPEKVRDGSAVAVDPRTGDLIIQLVDKDGVRLVRRTASGAEKEIRVPDGYRLTTDPLSPSAVARDGRILVEVASPTSWFWRVAVIDSGGKLQLVPTPEGDVETPGWTRDGRILARITAMRSSLWRFKVVTVDDRR